MRNYVDPKRFYKASDKVSKFMQVINSTMDAARAAVILQYLRYCITVDTAVFSRRARARFFFSPFCFGA